MYVAVWGEGPRVKQNHQDGPEQEAEEEKETGELPAGELQPGKEWAASVWGDSRGTPEDGGGWPAEL